MSTSRPFSAVPEQDRPDDASSQPKEEKMTEYRPARTTKERRLEIGFFIRKIVKGWLAYYKMFPPRSGHSKQSERPLDETPRNVLLAASSPARSALGAPSGDVDDRVDAQDGPGIGNGDPGPVGEARFEGGFFAEMTTHSTDGQS